MTEYKSITIFKVLKFKQVNNLIDLNKSTPTANGFNDEVEVGIFQMIGYNKEEEKLLIRKPISNTLDHAFILTYEGYNQLFEELLTFTLFNN